MCRIHELGDHIMTFQEELYLKRVGELDQITDMRDSQRKLHESLRKQRLDDFMGGFSVITNKLKEMYQMITLGGDAELELVDSLDPFSEGIVFRYSGKFIQCKVDSVLTKTLHYFHLYSVFNINSSKLVRIIFVLMTFRYSYLRNHGRNA